MATDSHSPKISVKDEVLNSQHGPTYGSPRQQYREEVVYNSLTESEEQDLSIEEKIMRDIMLNPIPLFGDSVTADNCPEQCNNRGVCQRIYSINHGSEADIKELIHEKSSYTARYICACKQNYVGETCNHCHAGFYGEECLPCPRNPADHTVCGTGGVCDDG